MTESPNLRRDALFISVITALTRLRALAVLPLVFRSLGATEYGRWTVTMGFVAFLASLSHAQVHSYLNRRYLSASRDGRRTLVWTALAFGGSMALIVSLGLAIAAPTVARTIGIGEAGVPLLRAGAALLASHVVADLTTNYIRASGAFRLYSVLDALPAFAEIAAVAVVVTMGASLVVAAELLVVADVAIAAWCLVRLVRAAPPIRPSAAELRSMLRYSLPLVPLGLGDWLMNQSDRIVIAALLGTADAGVYSAAYALGSLPILVVRPLQIVLLAHLSAMWDRGESLRVQQRLALAIKAYFTLALPAAVGIALVGPALLVIVTGATVAEWNVSVVLLVSLGTALFGGTIVAVHSLLLLHWTRACGIVYMACAALNIVGNLALVPVIGIAGAALMTLVAYFACLVTTIAISRRELPIIVRSRDLAKIGAGVAVMTAFVLMIGTSTRLRLCGSIVVGATIYGIVVLWLKIFDEGERRALLRRSG